MCCCYRFLLKQNPNLMRDVSLKTVLLTFISSFLLQFGPVHVQLWIKWICLWNSQVKVKCHLVRTKTIFHRAFVMRSSRNKVNRVSKEIQIWLISGLSRCSTNPRFKNALLKLTHFSAVLSSKDDSFGRIDRLSSPRVYFFPLTLRIPVV